jgi:hypothetical protein
MKNVLNILQGEITTAVSPDVNKKGSATLLRLRSVASCREEGKCDLR